jgi:hypothetical protein
MIFGLSLNSLNIMDLAKKYVKSVAKRFQKLPVYYPGRIVKVGDILSFGKNSLGLPKNPFGEPIGVFGNLVNDSKYGNQIDVESGASDQIYHFVSENEVDLTIGGTVSIPDLVTGEFKFSFKQEGAILLIANGTNSLRMANQTQLNSVIQQHINSKNWSEYYIVTEVETAGKALIYQSISGTGELILSANKDNIQIGGSDILGMDAGIDFNIKSYKNSSFIVPWSENKSIFMKLVRVRKNGEVVGASKSIKANEFEIEEYSIMNWF